MDLQDYDSDEEEMADLLADNKIAEKAVNDERMLAEIFAGLDAEGFDMELTGYSDSELAQIFSEIDGGEVIKSERANDSSNDVPTMNEVDFANLEELTDEENSGEYEEFVDKFKPKKTTDDCYTPTAVYEAVKNWAVKEYELEGREIIRPFFPGGDYVTHEYPAGCVVIDNPPFSIMAEILDFYNANNIDYFLFAPSLTLFAGNREKCRYIVANCIITYENGAKVNTSFITNLEEYKIKIAPELKRQVMEANKTGKEPAPILKKYDYPLNVVTAARLNKIIREGVEFKVRPEECEFIRKLDCQKGTDVGIYGGAFLVSERAAAERAAERAAAEAEKTSKIWELSEREKELIKQLDTRV